MQMLILAFPTEPISLTVMSDLDLADEEGRQIAKEQCSYAELFDTIASLRDKYSANDIMLCGPWDYIMGIMEQMEDYFKNDLTLNVLPIPAGDSIQLPPDAEQRTESGLILNA